MSGKKIEGKITTTTVIFEISEPIDTKLAVALLTAVQDHPERIEIKPFAKLNSILENSPDSERNIFIPDSTFDEIQKISIDISFTSTQNVEEKNTISDEIQEILSDTTFPSISDEISTLNITSDPIPDILLDNVFDTLPNIKPDFVLQILSDNTIDENSLANVTTTSTDDNIPDTEFIPLPTINDISTQTSFDSSVAPVETDDKKARKSRKRVAKNIIPEPIHMPGKMLSVRHGRMEKGRRVLSTKKNTSQIAFKNAVTVDMVTDVKNVCIKLSKQKIHMCGANSKELSINSCNMMLNHLKAISANLQIIIDDKPRFDATIAWIMDNMKGSFDEEKNMYFVKDFNITNDQDELKAFLINQASQFLYFEAMILHMEKLRSIEKPLVSQDVKIIGMNQVMVNYIFKLNFKIFRGKLWQYMDKVNNFRVIYINSAHRNPRVCIPHYYSASRDQKPKMLIHTFVVSKSGMVTQSGANEELMEPMRELFLRTIMSIRHHIEDVE